MTKGFLVFAQNSEDVDYIKQAYVFALSVHKYNDIPVSIITNDNINEKYRHVFDKVIKFTEDNAKDSYWKIENRHLVYELSPYDETIVTDTDVLVLENINWDLFKPFDLYFTTNPITYRGNPITSDYYRKAFTKNNLQNVYVGLHYFKKSPMAEKYYKTLKEVIENWKSYYNIFLQTSKPNYLSIDVATAIALDLCEYNMERSSDVVDFVHMKPHLQEWTTVPEKWQSKVGVYYNKDLKIGNYKQSGVFHYVEKDFCDRVMEFFE